MTDQHAKGAINKTRGTVEEGLGKLTGDRKQQAKGTTRKVQGEAQELLGDVQDALHPKDKR